MSAKKIFFVIWLINILLITYLFVIGRTLNIDFVNINDFKVIEIILLLYMIYDYFKFSLEICNVDSQFSFILCLLIAVIFCIAGISFIIRLNFYRISEFSFFLLFSILFRILFVLANVPNFLSLKKQ